MDYDFLTTTNLFLGTTANEVKQMLPCLGAHVKSYKKDEIIYHSGDTACEVGLVLSGSVNIVVNFYWGSSNIFSHVEKGKIFGEAYAALPEKELFCDVVAAENCEILFLHMQKLMTTCQNGCAFHQRIIHNVVRISARKNLMLSTRMIHIAPKSIREKLLSYFSEQAMEQGSDSFTIPFSRQQLAEYLGVDRSALSAELSKMQKDGLITYKKNAFTLTAKSII